MSKYTQKDLKGIKEASPEYSRALEIDKLLATASKVMRSKLSTPKNMAKSSWKDMSLAELWVRLSEEKQELDGEFNLNKVVDYRALQSEAANVANFAAMIIEYCEEMKNKWQVKKL